MNSELFWIWAYLLRFDVTPLPERANLPLSRHKVQNCYRDDERAYSRSRASRYLTSRSECAIYLWMSETSRVPFVRMHDQKQLSQVGRSLRAGFSRATLAELREAIEPVVTPEMSARLLAIIQEAQLRSPPDNHQFVEQINYLLDLCKLRIEAHGMCNGRLRIAKSSIAISFGQLGSRGFQNCSIKLVPQADTRMRTKSDRSNREVGSLGP